MSCLTGDESGLVKVWGLTTSTQTPLTSQHGAQSRVDCVLAMCWVDEKTVVISHKRGKIMKLEKTALGWSLSHLFDKMVLPVIGGLFTETSTGKIRIVSVNDKGIVDFRAMPDSYCSSSSSSKKLKPSPKDKMQLKISKGPVQCAAMHDSSLAFGGKENDVKIWDIPSGAVKWRARNVEHDSLDMRVPIWPTAIQFLNPLDGKMIVVATAYQQIRIYDTRDKGHRPQRKFCYPDWDTRFTTLAVPPLLPDHIVAGDTQGNVFLVHSERGYIVNRLRPSHAGSIRALALHPTQPVLASAGLGRHILFHDLPSRKLIAKIYAKNKLNAFLFTNETCFRDTYQVGRDGKVHADIWDFLEEAPAKKKFKRSAVVEPVVGVGERLIDDDDEDQEDSSSNSGSDNSDLKSVTDEDSNGDDDE